MFQGKPKGHRSHLGGPLKKRHPFVLPMGRVSLEAAGLMICLILCVIQSRKCVPAGFVLQIHGFHRRRLNEFGGAARPQATSCGSSSLTPPGRVELSQGWSGRISISCFWGTPRKWLGWVHFGFRLKPGQKGTLQRKHTHTHPYDLSFTIFEMYNEFPNQREIICTYNTYI